MGGTTSPNAIPYMTATDPLAGLDEWTLSLATRLQGLWDMTQGGTFTFTGIVANTTKTQRITFPFAFATATPSVVACLGEPVSAATPVMVWAESVDNTGFTLGMQASNTPNRIIRWMAIP